MQIIARRCQSQPDCLHLYEHLHAPEKPKPCNPHVLKTYLYIDQSTHSRLLNCFLNCGGGIACQLVFASGSRLSFRYVTVSTTIRSQTIAWTIKSMHLCIYNSLQFNIVIRSPECGMQQGAPSSFVLTRSHTDDICLG